MPIVSAFGQKNQIERDLTSQLDGSTVLFSLPSPCDTASLQVYINGLRARRSDTIVTIAALSFTLSYAPSGDETLVVLYIPL